MEAAVQKALETRPIRIFFSYSHTDAGARQRLERALVNLRSRKLAITWNDQMIRPGDDWDREIQARLGEADIVFLLISYDFLNSTYATGRELEPALERHDRGQARVIPILIRPVDWINSPLSRLQCLPRNVKSVEEWPQEELAYKDIATEIFTLVNNIVQQRADAKPPQDLVADAAPDPNKAEGRQRLASDLPKLVDRAVQEGQFAQFCPKMLKFRPGIPQVYLITGEKMDRPDSLVERLHRSRIPKMLAELKPGALYPKIVETRLVRRGGWRDCKTALANDLYTELGLLDLYDPNEPSGTPLVKDKRLKPYSFVVVRHDIDVALLSTGVGEFVQKYIAEFWAGTERSYGAPQFILFLNLILPERRNLLSSVFRQTWPVRGAYPLRQRIDNDLLALCPPDDCEANVSPDAMGSPCKLLPQLTAIDPSDIEDWLWRYQFEFVLTRGAAETLSKRLFGEIKKQGRGYAHMDAAEGVLRKEFEYV